MPALKFHFASGEIRRVVVQEWPDLQTLHFHLQSLPDADLPGSYALKYKDADGDLITIKTNDDLEDMACTFGSTGVLGVIVTEAPTTGSSIRSVTPLQSVIPASYSTSTSDWHSPPESLIPAPSPPSSVIPARSLSESSPAHFPFPASPSSAPPRTGSMGSFSQPPLRGARSGSGLARGIPPSQARSFSSSHLDVRPLPQAPESVIPASRPLGSPSFPVQPAHSPMAAPSSPAQGAAFSPARPTYSPMAAPSSPAHGVRYNPCGVCFQRPIPGDKFCRGCSTPLVPFQPRQISAALSPNKIVLHIFAEDLDIGNGFSQVQLGKGTFGRVVKGTMKATGRQVAVKRFEVEKQYRAQMKQDIYEEAKAMRGLDHPFLVEFIGYMVKPEIVLVLELMEGGDLFHYLHNPGRDGSLQPCGPDLQTRFMAEIASGLGYLHAKQMSHRDIKSPNVLLDRELHCKLSDFGFAKNHAETQQLGSLIPASKSADGMIGTANYCPPEVYNAERYTQAGDLYALGVLFWEIAVREVPFESLSEFEIAERVFRGERLPGISSLPPLFAGMVAQLTAYDPNDRPGIEEVLAVLLPRCPGVLEQEKNWIAREGATQKQLEMQLEIEKLRLEKEAERVKRKNNNPEPVIQPELQEEFDEFRAQKAAELIAAQELIKAQKVQHLALLEAEAAAAEAKRRAEAAAVEEKRRAEEQERERRKAAVLAERRSKDPRGFYHLISSCSSETLELTCKDIGEAECTVLAEALGFNTTITTLNLAGNQISDEGAAGLAKALKVNSTLTELDLHDNLIRNDGCAALADALKINSRLTTLNLRGNRIEKAGGKAFAGVLRINSSLTSLSFSSNRIEAEGCTAIAEALKSNGSLTSLNLGDNKIGNSGCKAIREALKSNSKITSLNLWGNNLGWSAKRKLKAKFGSRGNLYVD